MLTKKKLIQEREERQAHYLPEGPDQGIDVYYVAEFNEEHKTEVGEYKRANEYQSKPPDIADLISRVGHPFHLMVKKHENGVNGLSGLHPSYLKKYRQGTNAMVDYLKKLVKSFPSESVFFALEKKYQPVVLQVEKTQAEMPAYRKKVIENFFLAANQYLVNVQSGNKKSKLRAEANKKLEEIIQQYDADITPILSTIKVMPVDWYEKQISQLTEVWQQAFNNYFAKKIQYIADDLQKVKEGPQEIALEKLTLLMKDDLLKNSYYALEKEINKYGLKRVDDIRECLRNAYNASRQASVFTEMTVYYQTLSALALENKIEKRGPSSRTRTAQVLLCLEEAKKEENRNKNLIEEKVASPIASMDAVPFDIVPIASPKKVPSMCPVVLIKIWNFLARFADACLFYLLCCRREGEVDEKRRAERQRLFTPIRGGRVVKTDEEENARKRQMTSPLHSKLCT